MPEHSRLIRTYSLNPNGSRWIHCTVGCQIGMNTKSKNLGIAGFQCWAWKAEIVPWSSCYRFTPICGLPWKGIAELLAKWLVSPGLPKYDVFSPFGESRGGRGNIILIVTDVQNQTRNENQFYYHCDIDDTITNKIYWLGGERSKGTKRQEHETRT